MRKIRLSRSVNQDPRQVPDFLEKKGEFDTTSYCRNVSCVKKVRKAQSGFFEVNPTKSLHTEAHLSRN